MEKPMPGIGNPMDRRGIVTDHPLTGPDLR